MEQEVHIQGMSCQGCRAHVEATLSKVPGVAKAAVNLEEANATLQVTAPIPIEQLEEAFRNEGGRYQVFPPGKSRAPAEKKKPVSSAHSTFYCPMQCEGDKIYPDFGSCPVCGMDLVPLVTDTVGDTTAEQQLARKFWLSLAFTLPIFVIAMGDMIPGQPLFKLWDETSWSWLQLLLSLPVVFYAAWMFFERAYRSLRTWNLNMFTLIGIGAGVAWLFSFAGLLVPDLFPSAFKTASGTVHVYFEAATVILTLVLLGQLLEARAHGKTNTAIKELLKLTPKTATVLENGQEKQVAIQQIVQGDLLKVKPGEKVPVDGVITEGETAIDESMITGEPLPVNKGLGDQVSSGTINGNQVFLMKAEKVGSDTLLSQIIEMVNEASRSRAPIQNLADKVSSYFVPAVVVIALITFGIWAFFGPEPSYAYALVNAIAVLIIACPCALGLATPMSVMVGVGKGAQNGVLIKNAEALETLSRVDTVIVDKTGTLTAGKPAVQKVGSFKSAYTPDEILRFIVALNRNSEHPLARATMDYAEAKKIDAPEAQNFKAVTGQGVEGSVKGRKLALGNPRMMEATGGTLHKSVLSEVEPYLEKGKTVSYLSIDGEVVGYISIGDRLKDTSAAAIDQLQKNGLVVMMFTGDQYKTASALAKALHLNDFKAGMLPEDKLKEVERLQSQGRIVAMAGDGINDAPALARADVGIAMGTGTDVAIESAGITLVKGDLQGIVKARKLSKGVMKNIKQNLFFALVYNTLGVPVAAGILYPVFGILLSPMIAALAMSFSSVSVITNALRLRSIKI